VNWYLADLVHAVTHAGETRPRTQLTTVLVEAGDEHEAYDKAMACGRDHEEDDVRFVGLHELTRVLEPLGDGAELAWQERPGAEAEARATLEAAEAVAALDAGWTVPPVARADRLAAYRALGALHNIPDGPRIARSLLAPILAGRPSVVHERLATLRAVLDAPGPADAAAALGIHRNTLAYRVHRIEALSGWRLTDPSLRLPLSMAVRLVQDAQSREPDDRL
jgi:hypothetical protein